MCLAQHLTAIRALVQAMSAWSVKTRCAPSQHCRDARVYGHTTTAMRNMSTPPPPPPYSSLGHDLTLFRMQPHRTRTMVVRFTKRYSPSRSWRHWRPSFVEMKRCEREKKTASPSRDSSLRIPWWGHPCLLDPSAAAEQKNDEFSL